jgi:hypothetical protein
LLSKLLFLQINQLVKKMLLHQNWDLRSKMLFHQIWKLEIDVSNNLCGLELTRMTSSNVDWKFRLKNDGLYYFKIYIY